MTNRQASHICKTSTAENSQLLSSWPVYRWLQLLYISNSTTMSRRRHQDTFQMDDSRVNLVSSSSSAPPFRDSTELADLIAIEKKSVLITGYLQSLGLHRGFCWLIGFVDAAQAVSDMLLHGNFTLVASGSLPPPDQSAK